MLHELREQAEGATPTFLLQRMSPFVAPGVFRCGAQNCDAIGGTADIDRPPASIASEAYDPELTICGQFCCDAVSLRRWLNCVLVRW
jgi:hypothetical protein